MILTKLQILVKKNPIILSNHLMQLFWSPIDLFLGCLPLLFILVFSIDIMQRRVIRIFVYLYRLQIFGREPEVSALESTFGDLQKNKLFVFFYLNWLENLQQVCLNLVGQSQFLIWSGGTFESLNRFNRFLPFECQH